MNQPAAPAPAGAPVGDHRPSAGERSGLAMLWVAFIVFIVFMAFMALTLLSASCGADRGGPEIGVEATVGRSPAAGGVDTAGGGTAEEPGPVVYEPVVIAVHPHDPEAFTQGLEFVDGRLLESTGLSGRSTIRLVEPESGRVIQSVDIEEPLFAEGATVVGDEVWQLTWQNQTLLVWSLDGLIERRRAEYPGEGWGLCATEDRLIMSDGSDRLTFRDRQTFEELGSVAVSDRGKPIDMLNELECVAGRVWANIWQTERMVSIDPATGLVDGIVDLSALVPAGLEDTDSTNVANGIAYHEDTGRFWLTGKRWPVIYEVELRPVP